ncbi:MAG: hypothetical protein HY821_05690 [Acidobacteria bacterium]|nr:hypothetical protein [Acidobacteriota bacterium]
MRRRSFVKVAALGAAGAASVAGQKLEVWTTVGGLQEEDGTAPLPAARWFTAEKTGDGMAFTFAPGALARARWLTTDMLLEGKDLTAWQITLREGEQGRVFRYTFGGLNQVSFRVRMDLSLVDQRMWQADREGAFLKPMVGGERVDLSKVDRMTFTVHRKGLKASRWCMTPLTAVASTPPKLTELVLPKGALLDEFGQSAIHDWPGKTRTTAELKARVAGQLESAPKLEWPEGFTKWGGWKARKLAEGTGFFGKKEEGGRWWLVDPDGYAFWSTGLDCVRVDCDARVDGLESALKWLPERPEYADAFPRAEGGRPGTKLVNYLAANMIRVFGQDGWREKWAQVALGEMKRLRFNTVGNWSDYQYAAKAQFPYVRPMSFHGRRCGTIYRDFPDVFQAGFEADAADYAAPLKTTAQDKAFLGYFLMNEPTWAFSSELPAAGMLYGTETCATREELAKWLRARREGDAALSKAWGVETTLERVARGRWQGVLPKQAMEDLREFSVVMAERYFQTISKACKQADPNHLNLGMRWAGVPPEWAVRGMKSFDVFSLNCYQRKLPRATAEQIHAMLHMPVLVGEWHFGALDVGLPSTGLMHVRTQADRAKAYRVYLEDAAAGPYCVGAHWFTMYDESALGRFDGENFNIGFLDICQRAYEEMGKAAVASHERIYEVASGATAAFADAPEYLPANGF